jgi:hypothetical protein
MFFRCWYLSILLFATNAFAQEQQTDESRGDVVIPANTFNIPDNGTVKPFVRLTGWEGCQVKDPCNPGVDKKTAIKKGFEDMQKMIPAYEDVPDPSNPPPNAYDMNWEDAAAVEFFGSFQKTGDYRSNVQENLNTLSKQYSSWFDLWSLHVRCDDPSRDVSVLTPILVAEQ